MQIVIDTPITVYDTNTKTVIGIFKFKALVEKYLFPKHEDGKQKVWYAVNRKKKINKNLLEIPIALRYANKEQQELLNNKEYLILNGYPEPTESQMKGFTDTRLSLKKQADESIERRRIEENRIKDNRKWI